MTKTQDGKFYITRMGESVVSVDFVEESEADLVATPRVDNAKFHVTLLGRDVVYAAFARELESELIEKQSELENLYRECKRLDEEEPMTLSELKDLMNERDVLQCENDRLRAENALLKGGNAQ